MSALAVLTEPEVEQPVSIFAKEAKKLFTWYDVEFSILESILGGIPGDPNAMLGWLQRTIGVEQADLTKKLFKETLTSLGYDVSDLNWDDQLDAIAAAASEIANVTKVHCFKRDKNGLYIEDRQIQAMLKEAASIVYPPAGQWFNKVTGMPSASKNPQTAKGLPKLMPEWVSVEPRRIYLGVLEPTEVITIVGHPEPGRSTLTQVEMVECPVLRFRFKVLKDLIPRDIWVGLLCKGEVSGVGAYRSMGYGAFVVTRFEKVA